MKEILRPEQNGVAERENRILVQAARSLLCDKILPIKLWTESINTASYVMDRSGPTQIPGKTPYELTKPVYFEHLGIFGTECFVHIACQKSKKFYKKAVKGNSLSRNIQPNMVGYCGDKMAILFGLQRRMTVR